ncbi:MAG: hypothetical protein Kow00108_13360 [Calditrichia bacterium]
MSIGEVIAGMVIVGLFMFIAIYLYSLLLKKKRSRKNAYVEALEAMVENDYRFALEKFKESARTDSDNIKAYYYLGNILREQGLVKNAIRIHLELTYRRNLSASAKKDILRALVLDYAALKDWNKIIDLANEHSELKGDSEILSLVLNAYEHLQKWAEVLTYLDEVNTKDTTIKKRKALYKVFYGIQVADEKSGHDARIIFKEAIKIDPECVAAYFYIAQTYFEENRLDDAIEFLKKLALKVPDLSFYAFKPLEETLLEKNEFPKVQSFYEELIRKNPEVKYPYYALANLYLKKGEGKKAATLLESFMNEYPEEKEELQKKLFVIYQETEPKKAISLANDILKISDGGFFSVLTCKKCNYQSREPVWICPECGEILSFIV